MAAPEGWTVPAFRRWLASTWLARLFAPRPAPRPGPYKLDDPEQDGPAWSPNCDEGYGSAADTLEPWKPEPLKRGWRLTFTATLSQRAGLLKAMTAKPPLPVEIGDGRGGSILAHVLTVSSSPGGIGSCEVIQGGPGARYADPAADVAGDASGPPFRPYCRSIVVRLPRHIAAESFDALIFSATTPTGVEVTYA